MTALGGDDREMWAVLVALEPLDDRKWRYVDLARRTFDSNRCLQEPWSSGERVLVACALGGRHLQAVVDAVAVRAGHSVASDASAALRRVSARSAASSDRASRARAATRSASRVAPRADQASPAREP